MFAITKRLLLRPGWIEDAPVLAKTIADERIVRNTCRMPWPYRLCDAEEFLSQRGNSRYPSFQIINRTVDPVRMIGGVGFMEGEDAPELGYWIAADRWNRGFATEAAKAALDATRTSLGYDRIVAGHFIDNPASGRVLEKIGFRRTGRIVPRYSLARGENADCVMFEFDGDADTEDTQTALAA